MTEPIAGQDPSAPLTPAWAGTRVQWGSGGGAPRKFERPLPLACILSTLLCWSALAADSVVASALAQARAGRYEEAIRALEPAAAAGDGEAKLERGRLLLEVGRRKEAIEAFVGLVEDFNARKPADSASLTWAGAAGAYTGSAQQAIRILEMAQKADPQNARAFLEAGLLFARSYQSGDAERELKAALALTPSDPAALTALARVQFDCFRADEMKKTAAKALAADPGRYEARLLLARVMLQEEETETRARAELEAALAVNPRSPETLSLLAAQEYLAGSPAGFESTAARALAVDPTRAAAFQETAQILARARRRQEAEPLFRRALELDGEHVPSLKGLAKLLLDTGRESAGRRLLERATKLDPFLVPAVNLLKTLDVADEEMAWTGRGNLVFRYHPWRDAALQTRLPAFAEACMKTLGAAPGFSAGAMAVPTWVLIEVFPEHKWFSARLVGLPWNGPVGACEGNIVLLDPPRALGDEMGFKQVMQHELAHAFHLTATGARVPNWFTEGFATFEEATNRPYTWDRILARAHRVGALRTFDTLNQGFLSPRGPGDWMLAYIQAELALEHLVEKYGPQAPVRMLQAYAQGLKAQDAIRQALSVDPARLARDIEETWRREAAASTAPPAYEPEDLPVLQEIYKKTRSPADAAEVARALAQGGLVEHCERLLARILTRAPDCVPALVVAGELALRTGDAAGAVGHLRGAAKLAPDDALVAAQLARAELAHGEPARAEKLARSAARAGLRGPLAHETLAAVARAKQDRTLLEESLEALGRAKDGDVVCRVELARLAMARKDLRRAFEILEEAALVDPVDAGLNEALADAHTAAGNPGEARRGHRDALAAKILGGVDGTPPETSVLAIVEVTRSGDGPRAQGACDLLGLLSDPTSLAKLEELAAGAGAHVKLRAAIALGSRGSGDAVDGLIEGLGCSDCEREAIRALSELTARPEERSAEKWAGWRAAHRSADPAAWLEEAAGPLGYPLKGAAGKERLAVLVVALDDARWYIRTAALAELGRLTGRRFGTGAFGPEGDSEPGLGLARREALERWKIWLEEQ
ncbi:MAG: tetratricopeptide repeat protein [Candidatus Wallbacteria bacterium]|nr:tetratricopeptide repeat protein [Candidatus Wallbacteria bacterium]